MKCKRCGLDTARVKDTGDKEYDVICLSCKAEYTVIRGEKTKPQSFMKRLFGGKR